MSPRSNRKPAPGQRSTSKKKNTWPWWAVNLSPRYSHMIWSADTLFWQVPFKADLDVIINLTLDPADKLQIFALLLRGLCSRNTQPFRQLEKVNLLFFIYATECWASRISWLESFGLDFSWTTALHCKITTNLKPWLFLLKNRIYT